MPVKSRRRIKRSTKRSTKRSNKRTTKRSNKRSTKRCNKRSTKRSKKHGGAPAKPLSFKEKLERLIQAKFRNEEEPGSMIDLTNSTIEVYNYASDNSDLLKEPKIRSLLELLLKSDTDAVEEKINDNEKELGAKYVSARLRLEGLINAERTIKKG